jgi:hypothetical protein
MSRLNNDPQLHLVTLDGIVRKWGVDGLQCMLRLYAHRFEERSLDLDPAALHFRLHL